MARIGRRMLKWIKGNRRKQDLKARLVAMLMAKDQEAWIAGLMGNPKAEAFMKDWINIHDRYERVCKL